MRYRLDIDGLRAAAVMPIVLFHAGVSQMSGGFVGVDIFFVISGFLITSIIMREIKAETFSIADFYRRRIVRIFPALFMMLFVVLAAGVLLLLPPEFDQLGRSAAATMGFVSNLFFWSEVDYFAAAAETLPLLHTWSLGVEEQFYIFYPLLLILARRLWPERLKLVLLFVILASFALGGVLGTSSPTTSFYMLPSRAWELAIGGLVALGGFPVIARPVLRNLAAACGGALILIAVLLVRADGSFPVPAAMVPCIGTALLLAYAEGTLAARLLSFGWFRAIGLISYSLYLWHWPIITFYRLETGTHLNVWETVALVAASLAAAGLSYRFVEQPVLTRLRHHGISSQRVVLTGSAAVAGGIAIALAGTAYADRWQQFSPQVKRIAAYADYRKSPQWVYQFRRGPCFRGDTDHGMAFPPALCVPLSPTKRNIVVLGDSHAAQYWRALALRYPDQNVMQATASGCRPLVGDAGTMRCREVVDYVLGPLLATGRVDVIVLGGRWRNVDLAALPATIRHIRQAGADVMLIGPTIEYEGEFPAILARAVQRNDLRRAADQAIDGIDEVDRQMAAIARRGNVSYVSIVSILCGTRPTCAMIAPDGGPMQFDYGHLTLSGSRWVVQHMPPV